MDITSNHARLISSENEWPPVAKASFTGTIAQINNFLSSLMYISYPRNASDEYDHTHTNIPTSSPPYNNNNNNNNNNMINRNTPLEMKPEDEAHDEVVIGIQVADSNSNSKNNGRIEKRVKVFDVNRLVTVIVKTMGKMKQADRLVAYIRSYFPYLPVLLSDDAWETVYPATYLSDPNVEFLKLPFDCGLAEGRNLMLEKVTTPLVWMLDDDFIVDENSDLSLIVYKMLSSGFDILSFKNPVDENRYKVINTQQLDTTQTTYNWIIDI